MKYSFLYYTQLLIISHASPSIKSQLKCWSKCPLSDWKMKYSLLYYSSGFLWLFQVWVFKLFLSGSKCEKMTCFTYGLLLFQSGSSVCLPLPLDGKVGIRVAEKFKFFRFMFNKFQPKDNSVQSLLHLLAMQLICDGQWTNWFTLHFYNL